jgi:hypothetical protein
LENSRKGVGESVDEGNELNIMNILRRHSQSGLIRSVIVKSWVLLDLDLIRAVWVQSSDSEKT